MKAIVSVFARDRIGIIADVCVLISSMSVNILDLNQTIMNGFFTMVMLVDTSTTDTPFDEIRAALETEGHPHPARGHLRRDAQGLSRL